MPRAVSALATVVMLLGGCRFDPAGVPVRSTAEDDIPRLLVFPDQGGDLLPRLDREPALDRSAPDQGPVDFKPAEVPTCGPGTCAGCCQGNVCQTGDTPTLCGAAGAPCQDCAAAGQVCVGKTCQGCTASAQCPGDDVCVKVSPDAAAGSCEPPWGRSWHIQIVNAQINCQKDWEGSMSNPPDPYVKITVGNWVAESTWKDNTCTPQWNAYAERVLSKSTKLVFTVWEHDPTNADDWIGEVSYPGGVPIALLKAGEIDYQATNPSDGLLALLVKLWPMP